MAHDRRVVITGAGAVTSLGASPDEIWAAIKKYNVGYSFSPDRCPNARFFGLLQDDKQLVRDFPKPLTRGLPSFARMALFASSQAVTQAFGSREIDEQFYSPFDRSVVLGTGYGWIDSAEDKIGELLNHGYCDPFSSIFTMHNVATAAASIHWNCRGPQLTPIAACASGAVAIGEAAELIRSGRTKIAVAGAADSFQSRYAVWAVDVIGALSKEQSNIKRACCPFTVHRSGFVPSSGAGAVVLEELTRALARKANILGEVTGYACTSDAEAMTAPAADLLGRITVIEKALESAAICAGDLDYINAHGTSTPVNDLNETKALKHALGQTAYNIPISSTKSYTGHTIGAAGALETVICLKAIEDRIIPATIHADDLDPECDLDFVPNQHRENVDLSTALNLSFGFGGVNAALVLKRFAP